MAYDRRTAGLCPSRFESGTGRFRDTQIILLRAATSAENRWAVPAQIGGYFAATDPVAVTLRGSPRFRPVRGSALVPGRIASRCRGGSGTGRAVELPGRSGGVAAGWPEDWPTARWPGGCPSCRTPPALSCGRCPPRWAYRTGSRWPRWHITRSSDVLAGGRRHNRSVVGSVQPGPLREGSGVLFLVASAGWRVRGSAGRRSSAGLACGSRGVGHAGSAPL